MHDISSTIQMMATRDKEVRQHFSNATNLNKYETKQVMRKIDASNTLKLKALIARFGWGETIRNSNETIWTIIQHADHDLRFQQRAYKALRRYSSESSVKPWQIASLYDRIALNLGRPQKYGTQLTKDHKNKKWQPWPLKDNSSVDIYREAVGLEPIKQYIDNFNSIHPIK